MSSLTRNEVVTRIACRIAQECCRGRLVSVLEGDYNIQAPAESSETHLCVLQE
jgi:acetoin utilization deacetylase AcuC-like enzyme